jgi:hypothetical protein
MPKWREYALWIEGVLLESNVQEFGIHKIQRFSGVEMAIETFSLIVIGKLSGRYRDLEASICIASNLKEPIFTFKMITGERGK